LSPVLIVIKIIILTHTLQAKPEPPSLRSTYSVIRVIIYAFFDEIINVKILHKVVDL